MRIIIFGGTSLKPFRKHWEALNDLTVKLGITELIIKDSGKNLDRLMEGWATEAGIKVIKYRAPVDKYPILEAEAMRDEVMLRNAQAVIAFPGGRIVKDFLIKAEKAMKPTWVWEFSIGAFQFIDWRIWTIISMKQGNFGFKRR